MNKVQRTGPNIQTRLSKNTKAPDWVPSLFDL